jgi:formylglycine-generating enzyme required for sulfatase activity
LQRQVTISSDYYISIYPVTHWQRTWAGWTGGYSNNRNCTTMLFNELRGMTNADAEVSINWPFTGLGEFGENTFLGKIREITGGKLMIDLPTETQWEVAMRAGTTTIFPNGGTSSNTRDELQELWLEYSPIDSAEGVGLRKPNPWDIYNPVGMVYNWCLDAVPRTDATKSQEDNKSTGQSGLDPVGHAIQAGEPMLRIGRGNGWNNGKSIGSLPGHRRAHVTSAASAFRLAIHLADPRIRR